MRTLSDGWSLEARALLAPTATYRTMALEPSEQFWRRPLFLAFVLGCGVSFLASGVVAVGIASLIDWRQDVAAQADAVHRQGGVAIAAHPVRSYWPAFDATAMAKLDGAEICHPLIYVEEDGVEGLEGFLRRGQLAAIGSSDTHGPGPMGLCRTYVFARDRSASAIVEAGRAHRTVVYGFGGKAYGDPALIAQADPHRLREAGLIPIPRGVLDVIGQAGGLAGLLALVVLGRRETRG
jgi:hypothetical protein